MTTGGLSKKPGQVCDSGVNLLPNNKSLVEMTRGCLYAKRRRCPVCVSVFINVILYSMIVYLTVAYYLYRTVYFLTKLWHHCLFIIVRKAVFFPHGGKVWADSNIILITVLWGFLF